VVGSARIPPGQLDGPMPRQALDQENVAALFEWVGGKTMPQRVDGDRLAEAGRRGRPPTRQLQRALRHWPCWIAAGKQPVRRPGTVPIVAKNAEQLLG